jgi:hypothetical protein
VQRWGDVRLHRFHEACADGPIVTHNGGMEAARGSTPNILLSRLRGWRKSAYQRCSRVAPRA